MNSHQRESPAELATPWEMEIHEAEATMEQENIEAPLLESTDLGGQAKWSEKWPPQLEFINSPEVHKKQWEDSGRWVGRGS